VLDTPSYANFGRGSVITIDRSDPAYPVWQTLLKLAPELPGEWTLIGAQMVALHGLEHNRASPRLSEDADIIVNARIVGTRISDFARALEDRGYDMEDPDQDGIGHRFSSSSVSLDVLGPDGLGKSAKLTTIAPAKTIQVPGGTQALRRSEEITVSVGELSGGMPRPNLLGAILVKARAVDVDDVPEAQLQDLAFLLSLIRDPEKLRNELGGNEQIWLRRRVELNLPEAPAWRRLPNEEAENGYIALKILCGTES
jgi:hypothetical protein